MLPTRAIHFFAVTTAAGTSTLAYLTVRVPHVPVPDGTLLKDLPHADCFTLRVAVPTRALQSRSFLDTYVRAFEHAPVFQLEHFLLAAAGRHAPAGTVKNAPVGKVYAPGTRMGALWTTTARKEPNNEVLLKWRDPGSPANGASWFRYVVDDEQPPAKVVGGVPVPLPTTNVTLQFGSAIDVASFPKWAASGVVMTLHYTYSRVLLVNAAVQLWWDTKHLLTTPPAAGGK
ncbi:hypothetical protein AMAG_15323 [Allomyces macrogynus ATCC 38327]|uniref:Uncharacterized protein n=1 Tax=Allomyces macrogynus (strain ATCC 38327) TaxID=578462 RepID=A0A0L0T8P5_ALLM3|nr:hypothetical protein AMAG_15323 [Allomyces macrogynus ATCC 38327]|eukprot:KNE71071.1 hypothetical protein AMAG_15323 [Allomyces macrogynus ATCC 38327]